jgi:hypothetical protein
MRKKLLPKQLFFIATLFLCLSGWSQQDPLIQLALSDINNFEVMSFWYDGQKMPKKIYVFDTTEQWRTQRFYLEGLNENRAEWSRDEHHPYLHTYLFRDSVLDSLFPPGERKMLSDKAAALKSRKIKIKTSIASTVSSFHSIKSGFIVWVTDPVFSSDNSYAFIDFTILDKYSEDRALEEAYHATVCVIYRKENGQWRKWKLKKHVIL